MIHTDDHILVVKDEHSFTRASFEMLCPFTANPQRRRGVCGVLEHCGCQVDFDRIRDKYEYYFGQELELDDWVSGFDVGFDGGSYFRGDGHKACPRNGGAEHHIWEGELHVGGTSLCGYQEELSGYGADLFLDDDRLEGPGRYLIQIRWYHEESEVEKLEKVG